MKRNLLMTITTGWLLFTAIACQKKDEVAVQPDKVTIYITSPTSGQVVKSGAQLNITASISYISQMHGYIIRITDEETGETYYEREGHAHGDEITVNEQWINSVTTASNLSLEITAVIDHESNETKQYVAFKSQP